MGGVMFWSGFARLVVLYWNGAWRPSPEDYVASAIFGGLIFVALAYGFEAAGVASTGSITYGFLTLGEGSNISAEPPGFAGGSNFQIGWSHDEQNDEQVFP